MSDEETEADELTNTKQKSMIQLDAVDGAVECWRVHLASRVCSERNPDVSGCLESPTLIDQAQ